MTIKFNYDPGRRQGIVSGDRFDELREAFSVHNDSAKFARYGGARYIPTRKYVITPAGRFETGLFFEIKKYILSNIGKDTNIYISDELKKIIYPGFNITKIQQHLSLTLRDYQNDIVRAGLSVGRGVCVLATAGGKTLTIASLIEHVYRKNNQFKCVVLVPDRGLVNQTFGDFGEYKCTFSYSKWTGDNKLDISTNIVIANIGILQSSKSNLDWLQDIDLLIVDEVHKLRKSNKINKIIKSIRTPNKLGFTGTLPPDMIDQWNIFGHIGPLLYEKNSFQLRVDNYIANVLVQFIRIEYSTQPGVQSSDRYSPSARYRRESKFIINNTFRNNIINKLCSKFDNNCLIMVDYIEHGEKLYSILKENNPDKTVYFIRGDVDVKDRDKVKSVMENKKNVICVAISKIFSTGINIKNLHYIVFASGGKAKVKLIQSIGRGLRWHKDKKDVIIIDIADKLFYGNKHYVKRKVIYRDESIRYGIRSIKEKETETIN